MFSGIFERILSPVSSRRDGGKRELSPRDEVSVLALQIIMR